MTVDSPVWLRYALLILLLVFIGRIAFTYPVFNDTMDENVHISSGLDVLQRGQYTIDARHPCLPRVVVALLPFWFAGLRLNDEGYLWEPQLARGDYASYWKSLTLARIGNLSFAILLFVLVYRWTSMLYGRRAGVAANLLMVCCPTLIAHAGLATTDLASAATVLMASYAFWRWSRQPGWRTCLAAAVAFSLAVLSKLSAVFFLPPLLVIYFSVSRWKRWTQAGAVPRSAVFTGVSRAFLFAGACLFFLWAGYLFERGEPVPFSYAFGDLHHLGPPTGLAHTLAVKATHLVPGMFVRGLAELLTRDDPAYVLGHLYPHALWWYFLVAIAVKSTIPMLVLVCISAGLHLFRRYAGTAREGIYPLLAVAVVLAASMFSSVNIGVRHVLPLYPLFAILAAGVFADREKLPHRRTGVTVLAVLLATWHAGESVIAHPDYLAYFNEIARGREAEFLADSNLDWGQDLQRLSRYLREHKLGTIHLGFFGAMDPSRMGIQSVPLPPLKPVSGWIAISVNVLVGVDSNAADYEWLRKRKPVGKVGKSIWLYYVPPAPAAEPSG